MNKRKLIAVTGTILAIICCIATAVYIVASNKTETTIYLSETMYGSYICGRYDSFEDVDKTGIYRWRETETRTDAQSTMTSIFDDEVYTYLESKCDYIYDGSEQIGSFYSIYDIYADEQGEKQIGFIRDTGDICWYSLDYDEDEAYSPGSLENA